LAFAPVFTTPGLPSNTLPVRGLLSRLRPYGIFRDFTWPNDLQPFARFNPIYGWNGTGKTTLAGLFRSLQDKTAITTGDVVFDIGDRQVKGSEIPETVLPAVRVFNRDSIAATVAAFCGEIAPIYFFGQDSVEKQRQVEELKKGLGTDDAEAATAKSNQGAALKGLDDFCIARAKVIKEFLISSRSTTYNNYDKRRFRQAVENLDPTCQQAALLQDDQKARLRSQKDAQPKAPQPAVACEIPDFAKLAAGTNALLSRSVVSKVISALANDRDVGTWVHQGLALHTGDRSIGACRFCGQDLPRERMLALEAHFNDAFSQFHTEIDSLATTVEDDRKRLAEVALPDSSRLYDHLATDLDVAQATTRGLLEPAIAYLEVLHAHLVAKRGAPFTPTLLDAPATPNRDVIIGAIAAVNGVIEKHNATTSRFENEVESACQKLELCYVAEAFDEFMRLRDTIGTAHNAVTDAAAKARGLRDRIVKIEREIVEHLRPAEELNAELRAYLGRDELRFEVKKTGYTMTRNGQPASGLSEGEKTAIAFLYFLKSLQDKSFDLANGVVVIDDPVSSLDANALFSAFSYMKERTKNAGQLFVLTHSFPFLRQVKNWYHYINRHQKGPKDERPPARFFLLSAIGNQDSDREAMLGPMDKMLEEFDSEYHYLFKLVSKESSRGKESIPLENRYSMPNLARRLLEAFLAFRYPDCSGENFLFAALERVNVDSAKKNRILRLVNTHSHSGRIGDTNDDPWALSETGVVLQDVLDLIRQEDPAHFDGMVKRIGPAEADT
jgi:wobble nucleotide-excising tRNase